MQLNRYYKLPLICFTLGGLFAGSPLFAGNPLSAKPKAETTTITCPAASTCCATCESDPCECPPEPSGKGLPNMVETIPQEHICPQNDKYFQGYIQALVDMSYYEHRVTVTVQKGVVYLYNLPRNPVMYDSVVYFVENIPGVTCVKLECPPEEEDTVCEDEQSIMYPPGRVSGIWLPQQTILFQPLLADPRQSMYSGAYRFGDRVMGKTAGAVSFGEEFPIYRWRNVGTHCGDVQIGIEGCVFAVFNMTHPQTELMNADYFVAIPVTWAYDSWSWRFRIYHLSSHLGDEYMEDNPDVVRVNPSREVIDVFVSYQWNAGVRLYGGAGYMIHVDPSFPMKKPYIQYGAEFRFFGKRDVCNSLYMQPFLALNNQNAAMHNWGFDFTASLGLEWSKIQGVGRKVRISLDFHTGWSEEGQFMYDKTTYGQLKLAYGF